MIDFQQHQKINLLSTNLLFVSWRGGHFLVDGESACLMRHEHEDFIRAICISAPS
jgi:hypothetical protein